MTESACQINAAAAAIRAAWSGQPRVGIILGTGLAGFSDQIDREAVLNYEDIPHFPRATALGHKGHLVCGTVAGTTVVTMEGRFHSYEGYAAAHITLPVRVMKQLGVELLIVSNASGGLNPNYSVGDVVVLDDHINLMPANPLVGINDEVLGPRFPDMSEPYDPALVARALEIARRENFVAHRGVYVGLSGPNYETRAEYRFLRLIGADVVGMSTVPEVIVAAHARLRVLALSVVTNVCRPNVVAVSDGASVVRAAQSAEPNVRKIVLAILADLASGTEPAESSRCATADRVPHDVQP
ncbi:MAG TPA: purine-nucleoside phosphorylase [Pirellulales bacterium]